MSDGERGWREDLVADLEGEILEIGVGEGENLGFYQRAQHVYGIEPDPRRAAKARHAIARARVPITIDVAPAERLPYESDRFEHVVSSLVFCSVEDPIAALREIGRVLKPQGSLQMFEHVRPENALLGTFTDVVTPIWKRFAWNCHPNRTTIDTLHHEGWRVELINRKLIFVRLVARPPVSAIDDA